MLKDDILFNGVGQCGGNFVHELEKLNFNSYYINTALEDLDTIETDIENKYHIPRCKGMAKDHDLALEVLATNDNLPIITEKIYQRHANARIVYFVGSHSGGTGGMLCAMACDYAEAYPDKIVNVISILPSSNEDMLNQANALKTVNEVIKSYESGYITNIQILDNNKKDDKMLINGEFARLMNSVVSFNNITKRGNFDVQEMEKILTAEGFLTITQFKNEDFAEGLSNATENSIYADWLKISDIQGYILNKDQDNDINKKLITEIYGIPKTAYETTWDNETNIILSVSEMFNSNIVTRLQKTYKEISDKRSEIQKEATSQLNNDIVIDINLEDVSFQKTKRSQRNRNLNTGKPSVSTQVTANTNSIRRSGSRRNGVNNTLERMRNMK